MTEYLAWLKECVFTGGWLIVALFALVGAHRHGRRYARRAAFYVAEQARYEQGRVSAAELREAEIAREDARYRWGVKAWIGFMAVAFLLARVIAYTGWWGVGAGAFTDFFRLVGLLMAGGIVWWLTRWSAWTDQRRLVRRVPQEDK